MAMFIIKLDKKQLDVLRFILDSTIEEWSDQHENSVVELADDPTITSLVDLLETAGSLHDMNVTAQEIREMLTSNDQRYVGSATEGL